MNDSQGLGRRPEKAELAPLAPGIFRETVSEDGHMTLTRIDADLINYDFYDSLVEAETSFFESMFLVMTYIAYACTEDGNKQKTATSPSEIDVPSKLIPKKIDDGHIVDLSSFKISSRSLLDVFLGKEDGIEVKPRLGINLSPILLFEGLDATLNIHDGMTFFQMIFRNNDEKNSGIDWDIVPVKDVCNLKPTDILSDDIIIKPIHYELMTSMLLSVAAFRLSVFQPILAGCGIGCIQLPIIDDDVWLPGVGTLKTIKDESCRKNMPKYNDVILKVKDYIFETRSKINILFDDLERRKGIANPSITKRVQETYPDGTDLVIKTVDMSPVKKNKQDDAKKPIQYRWSRIMTKKEAVSKLGWTMHDLRMHLAQNMEAVRQERGCRERWRFDCNDPSFADLPIDEAFNKSLST